MAAEYIDTNYPQTTSNGNIPPCLVDTIRDLTAECPETRKRAIHALKSAIESGTDISPVLPFLEKAIFDEDQKVRRHAVAALQSYALSMYKIDITPMLHDLAEEEEELEVEFFYPLTTQVVSTALVPVAQTECGCDRVTTKSRNKTKAILLPHEHKITPIPLYHHPARTMIEYASRDHHMASYSIKRSQVPCRAIVKRTRARRSKNRFAIAMMVAIILTVIVSFNKVSTGSNIISFIGRSTASPFSAKEGPMLMKPVYLTQFNAHSQRFIDSESAVFDVFVEMFGRNRDFIGWFNSLREEQKRGFVLFIRSAALSDFIGDEILFTGQHWLSGRSEQIRPLAVKFLQDSDIRNSMRAFEAIYFNADSQRTLFLENNGWLRDFLNENYTDFEKGLVYFFEEHSYLSDEVEERSYRFLELKQKIVSVSEAIVADRGGKTRISPKSTVTDGQIREIVASAYFAELFYGIPADFITLISAYETNFSMEYWKGGFGTTQQTTRAANTVLQSDYWIDRVYESAGVKIRLQLVTISILDNVFLCIIEGAKTISIKAAELEIRTNEITPKVKVDFEGKKLPATWVTAYKYNGSRKHARSYARNIQRYYRDRKWWLRSFDPDPYLLIAMKSAP
jgi:hypothetical protein